MKPVLFLFVFITVYGEVIVKDCNGYCQFDCGNGTCIPERLVCDGIRHCSNGSDEPEGCPKCRPGQFQCANGKCLSIKSTCDGFDHCGDGSDEYEGCPSCPPFTFECENTKECISDYDICNGLAECEGSDKLNCPPCLKTCSDGTCLPEWRYCDGDNDCGDWSDEPVDCPTCQIYDWECLNGECIWGSFICDGIKDCGDGGDESENCAEIECPEEMWRCPKSGRCVENVRVCDGRNDCGDYGDETCEVCEFWPWNVYQKTLSRTTTTITRNSVMSYRMNRKKHLNH